LTLPRAAAFCFGLSLIPLEDIATAGVFSLDDELVRLVRKGGITVPLADGGKDLARGGVARREAGDAAAIASSTCRTSSGIGTLKTILTAFQSTADIILNSHCWGGRQQPGQPLLLLLGTESFRWTKAAHLEWVSFGGDDGIQAHLAPATPIKRPDCECLE